MISIELLLDWSKGQEKLEISSSGTGPEKAAELTSLFLVDDKFSLEGMIEKFSKFRGLFFRSGEELLLSKSLKPDLKVSLWNWTLGRIPADLGELFRLRYLSRVN